MIEPFIYFTEDELSNILKQMTFQHHIDGFDVSRRSSELSISVIGVDELTLVKILQQAREAVRPND